MRLGQIHGPGPAAFDQLRQIDRLLRGRAVLDERPDSALGEAGYIAKAMLAEASISLTVTVSVAGRPWPPNSAGADMPVQPPSAYCLKASRNPVGVVTGRHRGACNPRRRRHG